MEVIVKAKPHEREVVQEVLDNLFPHDRIRMQRTPGGFIVSLDEPRSNFVIDELRGKVELPTFVDFYERDSIAEDQRELPLVYDPTNPIHATAA